MNLITQQFWPGDGQPMELLSAWKRAPFGFLNGGQRNYLMKKDEFVAPGVLRFGKRMPGVNLKIILL